MDRVKELEMELAQTKLALVETKCRNQELTHQIAVHEESSSQSATAASSSNKKWFAKPCIQSRNQLWHPLVLIVNPLPASQNPHLWMYSKVYLKMIKYFTLFLLFY